MLQTIETNVSPAALSVTGLPGAFGASVTGLDLAQPIEREILFKLVHALRDHHVLVIEGQTLSKPEFLAFGRRWGEPITFFHPALREVEYPQLIVIDNKEVTPEKHRNAAMQWHVDSSYEFPAASVTMLYGVEAPEAGNETLFADMAAAYEALSPEMQARIAGLVVKHGVGDPRLNLEGEYRGQADDIAAARARPPIFHPLVVPHPLTGRKAIYAPSGSAFGIVGMEDDATIALLRDLKRHAGQPQFVQTATVRQGSVMIWDNYAIMHKATPTKYSDKDGERRLLYRISTRDVVVTA